MERFSQGYHHWQDDRILKFNGATPSCRIPNEVWKQTSHSRKEFSIRTEEYDAGMLQEKATTYLGNQGKPSTGQAQANASKVELEDVCFWEVISLEEAFSLLDNIDELIPIDSTVCILHKSREKRNLVFAKRAHAYACCKGLEAHTSVGNHIVPMFLDCGGALEAHQSFNRLAYRNEHAWTSLVLGYIQCGKLRGALNLYQEMTKDNVHPSSYTLVALLQACAKLKDVGSAAELHVEITRIGYEKDTYVGSALIHLYAKCGLLIEARDVLDELPMRGVVSWNALIAGYAEHGPSQEVFDCIQQMQSEDVTPNDVTYSCILKACGSTEDEGKVFQLHQDMAQDGFEMDLSVGNSVIGMYAKCGSILDAEDVFDSLPNRDVVSWNALITGCVEHGFVEEVMNLFEKMVFEGISPNAATFSCTLRACSDIGASSKGQELHMEIVHRGLERDLSACNGLVCMYTKFGLLLEAEDVFAKMSMRDVITWTALIAGYTEHGADEEALKQFEQMQVEGVSPDAVTYTCILKACGNLRAIERGRELSKEIVHRGLIKDLCVCNSLLGMYVKCASFSEARDFFDDMSFRNIVTWTTLITGYADEGRGQEALVVFKLMQLNDILPNTVTLAAALKSCASIGALDEGQAIHAHITEHGYDCNELVCSSLVCMYAKCGWLAEAVELADVLPSQNVVWWNALLLGYVEHGTGREAFEWFEQMQIEGVLPDVVTYSCMLKACANVGALDTGQEIHKDIVQRGFGEDPSIGNSLISMYSKCGSLSDAHEIFALLIVQDVVAWSSIIIGYGINHKGKLALQCFNDMQEHGVKPDVITFTRLLTACSHTGLVAEGLEYFKKMRECYGISPTEEHFTSMVDIHARSGHLYEAENFIEMLCPCSEILWGALLSACKTYGEADLGLRCFHQLVEMNPKTAAWHVLMADIYAGTNRRDIAYQIEELRKHAGTKKKRGSALIEVNKKVHEFIAGDNSNKEVLDKLATLSSQVKQHGHRPHLALVLKPVSDEEKEEALCEHAEKLAIAFGLLSTPQGQTLRISKNLRMCNDCHDASKLISRIERREIILKDECCMHHFKDGACTCGDMF